ncbi:MAG: reverse transcriptase-like protein [Calditrichaeota bacterium]|nr:MAG: reverse transcriptase-like protein [Calditrichota bacterium]
MEPLIQVTLYVDASFLPEIGEGFGCLIWQVNGAGQSREGERFVRLGSLRDSMNAEFRILEHALRHLRDRVLRGISPRRAQLQVWTDNMSVFRSLNGMEMPPAQPTLSRFYREVRCMLQRYQHYQVGRKDREENPAGVALEGWISRYRDSEEFRQKQLQMMVRNNRRRPCHF